METIEYRPIGIIHSPFKTPKEFSLTVKPFLDNKEHGVFATRAPSRPNPIGISVVRLTRIESSLLYIQNVDVIDGTPLLDVKPYVPAFDVHPAGKIGWIKDKTVKVKDAVDDERFIRE
jgi:tRNA (Thr-GGU) A37 N-methylase